ncbi:MAG: cytoplasmic protein [Deltaproteobacteria bacterium]|nr:cytoplasmic protein [Deltaproteobacteria bacterium]
MKHLTWFIMSILLVTLALGLATKTAMAQDLAILMPNDIKVLVDNDRVRVLDVLHKPGVKEPMHSHPAYVAVFLSATRQKVTTPDGKTVERDRKAGEVSWSGPVTHALENIGTTDQHVIVIELEK